MQDYLFHRSDEAWAIAIDVTPSFEDDSAAILHALSPTFPQGCELRRDDRRLGRFGGPACPEPATGAAALAA